MKNIYFFTIILFTNITIAQEFKNYDWEKPEKYIPLENEKDQGEIHFFSKTIKEFVIAKDNNYDFTVRHTKTYLNSDDAIERNNKVYIPFKSDGEEILVQKVRVIKADGSVVEVSSNDIKESEDEETKVKYKYFALKGLEKNCVVEQLIIGKYSLKFDGRNVILQNEYLNKNVTYELIYPKHLIFNLKSYNGLPNCVENSNLYADKISKKIEVDLIPFLKEEKYSNYVANAKKISYKLSGNLYSQKYDLYNYKDYTNDILTFVSEKMESKESTALNKFSKLIPTSNETLSKIRNIEDYVKKNIAYYENYDGKTDILTTLNNKFTSSLGLLKLYKNIFDMYKISSEIVITSNRFENQIDPKFESYANLDQFIFFFPETTGYLCPSELDSRFPNLPFKWTNSYGIFTKYTEFGGVKIPDYEIKKITTPGIDFTHDEMDIVVDFTESLTKPKVISKITFNGYSAFNFQPYYDFMPEDKYKDFEEELADNYCGQKENVVITTENTGTKSLGSKPYVFKASYVADNLIEKVGEKVLFKIGLVIGKQSELYQEDKRQMPIELQYPHSYIRNIKVILPKGYTVKNLEKINSNFVTLNKGNESCKFATTYKMDSQNLIVENIEYYKDVELPAEAYQDYIKVINAAADFNKLVLILQKN